MLCKLDTKYRKIKSQSRQLSLGEGLYGDWNAVRGVQLAERPATRGGVASLCEIRSSSALCRSQENCRVAREHSQAFFFFNLETDFPASPDWQQEIKWEKEGTGAERKEGKEGRGEREKPVCGHCIVWALIIIQIFNKCIKHSFSGQAVCVY